MKYYFIQRSTPYNYDVFGTSRFGINPRNNKGFIFDREHFWDYSEVINLELSGADQENILFFLKHESWGNFIMTIIPELKLVFEQFNMPEHRWYEAEAGYNKGFVDGMKKYFRIDYDIDINEKRDYWILQILDRELEEIDFHNTIFNVEQYADKSVIRELKKGEIENIEQFKVITKQEYTNNNNWLSPAKYIYRKNYDILWGSTKVVFNEKVKTALEATGIICAASGLEFVEFTEYEIEMLGEDSL